MYTGLQWRIQDSSEERRKGGGANLLIFPIFPLKLHENEKNCSRGGGCIRGAPFRSANGLGLCSEITTDSEKIEAIYFKIVLVRIYLTSCFHSCVFHNKIRFAKIMLNFRNIML